VEFLVQYLLLLHAEKHRQLTKNSGNIALLETLGSLHIVDTLLAKKVADAYREYRRLQHAAGLQGKPAKTKISLVQTHTEAVEKLWHAVFFS
jgi:glutamate-ammonia-ligase adenylyltransferase